MEDINYLMKKVDSMVPKGHGSFEVDEDLSDELYEKIRQCLTDKGFKCGRYHVRERRCDYDVIWFEKNGH